MGNLLTGLGSNANQGDNKNDSLRQMQMMYMSQNMDPNTMLGYKLGQLIGNYFYRGQHGSGTKYADEILGQSTNKGGNVINNALNNGSLQDQSALDVAAVLAPKAGAVPNQAAQPITQAAVPAVQAVQATAAPSILSGIPTAAAGAAADTAANMASSAADTVKAAGDSAKSSSALGDAAGAIGGFNSLTDIVNGNGTIMDIANIAKLAGFFDNATPGKTGVASQQATPDKPQADQQKPDQQPDANTAIQQLVQQAAANPPQPVLTPAQRVAAEKIRNDIIQAKGAYQQAQQNGDVAGMQQAHEQANIIRNTANRLGLSTAAFGADDTLNSAVSQKETEDYNEQIRRIVNPDPSSQMIRNQVYNALRAKGYGFDVANQVADEQASSYQAKRVQDLTTQLQNQGISQTGALNNYGVGALVQMLNESPQTYQALASMYANPKDDYNFNNAIKQAVNNEALQKDLAGFNSGLHMKESDHNLDNTIKLNDHNLGNTMQLKQFEAKLNVQQKAALAQVELQVQGMAQEQQYAIKYKAAKQYGADDATAKAYALGGAGGGRKSMSPEMIASLDAAKGIIADKQKWDSGLHAKGEEYPYQAQYEQAMQLYKSLLSGDSGNSGGGGSSGNFDPNDYNSVMSNATDWLSKVSQHGGYSKQQIINGFEKMYGKDMAQAIVNDIDWSQWGY